MIWLEASRSTKSTSLSVVFFQVCTSISSFV